MIQVGIDNLVVSVVAAATAASLIATSLERRAWRKHVQELERMLLAKSSADFAAGERILARPAESFEDPEKRTPGAIEQMWGETKGANP